MRQEARLPFITVLEKTMIGDMMTTDAIHAIADTMRETKGVRYFGDEIWWQIAERRKIKNKKIMTKPVNSYKAV